MKQASLGVLLIVAALFTGCAEDATVEQQRWHVSIKADRPDDDALTRSLYLDGSSALKAQWTGSEVLKVYNSSNVEVGTLTASMNLTGGSTTLTGDLTADVSIGDKLYIWSPSKTPDYSTQDGTVDGTNGISAKDYIKAEIEVEAKDNANHILKTSDASFVHQQSFTKFSVTPAVHSLKLEAEGMTTVTATLSGTTEGHDFYVALPSTGGGAKTFTLTGTTYAGLEYTGVKSKQLEDGMYYTGSMDLVTTPVVTAPTAKDLSYTGGAQYLVDAGTTSGGTLYYKMTTTNSQPENTDGFSTDIPMATNAGHYYVWYYVAGDSNYSDTDISSTPVSVTINKLQATVNTAPTKSDGWITASSAHNLLATAGTATNGTMYYYKSTSNSAPASTSVSGWTSTIPQATTGGIYYVWYCAKATDATNYDNSAIGGPLVATIEKAGTYFTSTSSGTKVIFAPGNLQAKTTNKGSSWTWSFAAHQWDYIGNAAANANTSINGNGTVSANGTVDLFGWVGKSSTWTNNAAIHGISNSTASNNVNGYGNVATEGLKSDWGTLSITNAGGYTWRSLSGGSGGEWQYILLTRTSGATVNGRPNARYTHATINTDGTAVKGLILFPDNCWINNSSATSWGTINGNSAYATMCTTAQWAHLEELGAVFLPAAGRRSGTAVNSDGSAGRYWSSSPYASHANDAYGVYFSSGTLGDTTRGYRYLGGSVRLVRVVP